MLHLFVMSAALIITLSIPDNKEIRGFSKYNENTLFHIGDKNFSLYDWIYTFSEEKGVYPENFANKRTYLEFIKKNKKQLKLDYFRLQCDLLEDLNGIPCNFFLCLTDITKIDKMLSLYGRFVFIDEISDKTLFEEGVLYHIGKK
ncbi:hypothetical protein MCC93_09130 [Morococcus cerebrosus]|uniref:Uncharacterized protein n=2 Tax=Morococcus cerebrosus TaxID=1056807 RepID=A0A0C1EBR4_9NEIS|nr:hypothetical protein MCC93_09130 [Morococcus cerebrosus]